MVDFTQDFFTSRRNADDGNTRLGQLDRLWYDSNTNTIRISDGITPGGIIVTGGGGGYVLPAATSTILGGIKVGSGLTILPDGTLSVNGSVLNAWTAFTVAGQSTLTASGADTLEIVAGDGIFITTNPSAAPNPTLTINAGYNINIDGGFPSSVYYNIQEIDGGYPGSVYGATYILDAGGV